MDYDVPDMCLIFVALDVHPAYPLIIAANRDEFYDRPALPASFWPEAPGLLAGRDVRAGGTWIGITLSGRIAALTNYRDPVPSQPDAPSRGRLVLNFLLGSDTPTHYLEQLSARSEAYNGFNILVGSGNNMWFFSNRENRIEKLSPGIHGLSNRLLDTPWPKVEKGKQRLATLLAAPAITTDSLLELLSDRSPAPDADLPDTGVGLEWERILSPIFISSPDYGTRSSTVILLGRDGRVSFTERSFDPSSAQPTTVHFEFELHLSVQLHPRPAHSGLG